MLKQAETRVRWLTAIKDKALDSIRNLVVLETQAEHFLKVWRTVLFPRTFTSGASTTLPWT